MDALNDLSPIQKAWARSKLMKGLRNLWLISRSDDEFLVGHLELDDKRLLTMDARALLKANEIRVYLHDVLFKFT